MTLYMNSVHVCIVHVVTKGHQAKRQPVGKGGWKTCLRNFSSIHKRWKIGKDMYMLERWDISSVTT